MIKPAKQRRSLLALKHTFGADFKILSCGPACKILYRLERLKYLLDFRYQREKPLLKCEHKFRLNFKTEILIQSAPHARKCDLFSALFYDMIQLQAELKTQI